MHHLMFAMKRSYHRALSKGRPLLEDLDLTPARFDMLFVLFSERAITNVTGFRRPATQKSIRQALGVSRETVSRMLESLEAKRFVRRGPAPPYERDGRTRSVELTDVGLAVVRRATKIVYPLGLFANPFSERKDVLHRTLEAATDARSDELTFVFRRIGERLGDFATLRYPTLDRDD